MGLNGLRFPRLGLRLNSVQIVRASELLIVSSLNDGLGVNDLTINILSANKSPKLPLSQSAGHPLGKTRVETDVSCVTGFLQFRGKKALPMRASPFVGVGRKGDPLPFAHFANTRLGECRL